MKRLATLLVTVLLSAASASAQLTCTVASCGGGCGPDLTVSFTPIGNNNHRVTMDVTGLHQNAITVLMWGDGALNVPMPFGGCPLLQSFIWYEVHTSSATGSFSWSRSWPSYAIGSYYMQMGSIALNANSDLEIRTSDCEIGACL